MRRNVPRGYQRPDTGTPAKGHRPPSIYWAGCGWTDPARSRARACKQALPGSGCADVTWPRMRRGGADFAVEVLNEAIHRLGPPEILNTEHGRAIDSSGPTPPRAGNRPPQLLQHHRNRSAGAESNSRQPEICPGIGEQLRKHFVTEVRNFADRRQGGSVVSPTGFEPVTH